MAASSSLEVHVVDCSESIRSIHRVQFGIDLVEETLDFVALVRGPRKSRRAPEGVRCQLVPNLLFGGFGYEV